MLTIHFELLIGTKLLNSNERLHYRTRAKRTLELRTAARDVVMAQLGITEPLETPLMERAHLLGMLYPSTRRRADPANWYPSFKAAVDGLIDAGVLADDDHRHVVGPDMRIGEIRKGGQIGLMVREVDEDEFSRLQAGALFMPFHKVGYGIPVVDESEWDGIHSGLRSVPCSRPEES